jgi:hypothetical protein
MSAAAPSNDRKRFKGSFTCPVCKGAEDHPRGDGSRCFGYRSGNTIVCTRGDHSGQLPFVTTVHGYRHVAKGSCGCGVEHAAAEPKAKKRGKLAPIECVFQYFDLDGSLRHETVRHKNPKGFTQRHPGPDGKPIWNLRGVDTILYRLPELAAADPAKMVIIPEGEKHVDRLRGLGEVATCNPMGARKWKTHYSEALRGRHCIILPDNDEDGAAHGQEVARSLHGIAAAVKVVELPNLPPKGDVIDFLDAGGTLDQIRELASTAPEWDPATDPAAAPRATPDNESHSQTLLRIAGSATLFHDDAGRAFATVPVQGHRETHEILGTGFRRWLKQAFYSEQGRPPSAQSFQDSLGVLEARAQIDGPAGQVFVRVAEYGSRTYLDLGDNSWRVVEIDAKGWRIVSDVPVRFRRPSGLRPLPEPARGGSIKDLKNFVNLEDADFSLLVAVLAAAPRSSGPYPILVLTGEQGTAKSTLAKIVRSLIDPHVMLLRSEPREPRDLMIGAINGWVLALDNISSIPAWLSDAFCRLATGGGQATRTLYTNDEETFLDAQRPVVLTGITDFVSRGDLIDRCVFLHLPVIAEDRRRTEKDFWAKFQTDAPKLLGAILDAVSGGLRRLPQTNLACMPRMADFAVFGEAVCRGLGYESDKFLTAYRENRKAANESAIEDSPVATAIRELVAKNKWKGTSSQLKDALDLSASKSAISSDRWPKSPRAMSGALRRLAPSLRLVGVSVEFGRGHERFISIETTPSVSGTQTPTRQAQQSPTLDLQSETCAGTCAGRNDSPGQQAQTGAPTGATQRLHSNQVKTDSAGCNGDIPTLSNGHAENAREVLEI